MSGRILMVVTVRLSGGGVAGYALRSCEAMGLPVDTSAYTIEQAKAALLALKGDKRDA